MIRLCLICLLWMTTVAASRPDVSPLFTGVVVPMITPYRDNGATIDLVAARAHADWLARQPVALLFPVSGTGQWSSLTTEEKRALTSAVIEEVGGRKPVAPDADERERIRAALVRLDPLPCRQCGR